MSLMPEPWSNREKRLRQNLAAARAEIARLTEQRDRAMKLLRAARSFVWHLDDVRENCALTNLAWGSQSDNMADAKRNGRSLGGYRPKRM